MDGRLVGDDVVVLSHCRGAHRCFSSSWANALLKRALSAAELITIIIMGLVASGMPIFMVGLILSIISKPYYGALPTNQWTEYVHPYLPDWAIPDPAHDAMRFFYEGLPSKDLAIPWGAWAAPLLWWLLLGAGHILRRLVFGGSAASALDGARAADLSLDRGGLDAD